MCRNVFVKKKKLSRKEMEKKTLRERRKKKQVKN